MATQAQITEIYQSVLGRAPDAEGLQYWSQALAGVNPAQAAQQIAQAAAAINPAGQSQEVNESIQRAQSFLNPSLVPFVPTSNEPLPNPATAAPSVTAAPSMLMPATTAPSDPIANLYRTYAGREPDAEGLAYWRSRFGDTISADESALFQNIVQRNTAALPTITAEAGQYGYQNNAPVLNASVARNILGNEFAVKADIGPSNELGWNTNSKYQGEILTGAGLYGIRGTSEEIQKILSAGETFRQLQAQGKVITTTDPETNTVNYSVQTGIDPETGSPTYVNYANLFNTSSDPENFNGFANAAKFQDVTAKLQDAATKLNIPTAGKTSIQLLNEVNDTDRRVAVVGRTQGWNPAQTGGVGGQQGAQHAAVVYQQVGDKLVAASPVQTFNFQDPNTTRGFFGDLIGAAADIISIPPIAMALSAFGAPYISAQLATLVPSLAGNTVALDAISKGLISGVTTGAITGDAEKAIIGALVAGGGSYAVNTGAIGDVLDRIGLGDVRTQFNIPTTAQVSANIPGIAGFGAAADQVGGALSGVTPGTPVPPGGPTTVTPIAPTTPGGGLFGLPSGPAGFAGIDLSTQLANQATGGLTAGVTPPLGTGGFGTALPSVATLTQNLINAGFSPGTAANLAGATLAGVGGVGTAVTGLLGTGGAGTAAGVAGAGTAIGAGVPTGGGAPSTPTAPGTPTVPGTGGLPSIPGIGTLGGLLSGLGNVNLGGVLGAGIDFAQLAALQREATGLGRELSTEAAQIGRQGAIPFTPYTVTTGAGVGTVGPGGATAVTSPEMQALRQQQLGLAGQTLGAINPAQAAQTLYGQAEALAAPGRAREQETLLAGLQRRGLTGFGQNLPTVGGGVRQVNPLFESLLSAQETARAQQALQAQQQGTVEALRQQQLAAGLQGQAQNVDVQQLNQLLRAQGLSQDQINLAVKNAEAQRISSLFGLQSSVPLLLNAAGIRAGQTANVGQAARNLAGTIFSAAVPSLFASPAANRGFGTGDLFGNQDYAQYFGP